MIDWESEVESRLEIPEKAKKSGVIPLQHMESVAMMIIAEKLDELVELELRKEKQVLKSSPHSFKPKEA